MMAMVEAVEEACCDPSDPAGITDTNKLLAKTMYRFVIYSPKREWELSL